MYLYRLLLHVTLRRSVPSESQSTPPPNLRPAASSGGGGSRGGDAFSGGGEVRSGGSGRQYKSQDRALQVSCCTSLSSCQAASARRA